MNIISLKNIDLSYNQNKVFENFNLEIKEGDFITILGENGSGKSTLVKIILGLIKPSGQVIIDNETMQKENLKSILSKIGFVFENPDNQFISSTVKEELAFPLENLQIDVEEIEKRIEDISKLTGIENLLDREPHTLSGGEKQLVSLASALINNPKILILDEALSMIDLYDRERIYMILKKINRTNKITIINVTHDVEEIIYSKSVLLLSKGKILNYCSLKKILENEKNFTSLGLKMPFMADLSKKLKYYNLVDKIYLNMDDMVDALWK